MDRKNHLGVHIEKNAIRDQGNGILMVTGGLVLTDGSVQANGTRYDVKSLDITSLYDGKLFANHGNEFGDYTIETVIGKLINVRKSAGKVIADGIDYAVNTSSALAIFAYNMTREGYLNSFSIGTRGPMPDETGTFLDHTLYEVSQVGIPNNQNAKINQIAINSIEQAREKGLDTTELEKLVHYNGKPEEEEPENMKVNKLEDTMSDEEKVKAEEEAKAKAEADAKAAEEAAAADAAKEEEANNSLLAGVAKAVEAAVKPLNDKIDALEKNAFDKGAAEPAFTISKNGGGSVTAELNGMDYRDRHVEQIEAYRSGDMAKLRKINEYHANVLKKEGLVRNSVTIEDMGNFVISPELLTEIQGCRTDYSPLVDATDWRETLSTQMAWLERSGDIDMQSVEFCADEDPTAGDPNANLKPISEYGATPRTANLEELAAVTPVCNAATRFLAVDLITDVAGGYRNDYDRKRAQLVVARLQQAVDFNGNSVDYNTTTNSDALVSWLDAWVEIASCTPNGTFLFSQSTYAEIVKRALKAGVNGPLAQLFTSGAQSTIFGKPFIVVSDDLLPTLGSGGSKTFVVDGGNVTVDNAVFYANLSNFTGRISGGLQYDLSNSAAYEIAGVEGNTVRSAFQRNEIVLRGSFFRGGAIKDRAQVSALGSPAIS